MMISKTIDIVNWINIDEKLYFKSYRSVPGLFCYDILLKKLSIIAEPDEIYRSWQKYGYSSGVGRVNKYVVFAPYYAKKFIVLNTENLEVLSFDSRRAAVYVDAVEYNDKLFVFAEKITDSVVFDSRTFLFEYPFSSQFLSIGISSAGCSNRKGTKVTIPIQEKDCIAEIDLESYDVNIRILGELNIDYNIIIPCGDGYILTGNKSLINIWDGNDKVETLELEQRWLRPQTIQWPDLFCGAILKDDKVFLCPHNYKMLTALNLTTRKIEYLYEMGEKEHANMNELPEGLLLSVVEDDNSKRNCLFSYDGKVSNCTEFDFRDEFKLSGANIEYSRRALQYFIDDLIS